MTADCSSQGLTALPPTLHRDIQVAIPANTSFLDLLTTLISFLNTKFLTVPTHNPQVPPYVSPRFLILVNIFNILQVLIMDGNYIRELRSNSLTAAGLSHLQGLSLRECRLTKIAEDSLARLTDLTELRLDGNNLTSLPRKLLAGSPRLEQVRSGLWRCLCRWLVTVRTGDMSRHPPHAHYLG